MRAMPIVVQIACSGIRYTFATLGRPAPSRARTREIGLQHNADFNHNGIGVEIFRRKGDHDLRRMC